MRPVAISLAISAAVFFVLMTAFDLLTGAGLTAETLWSNAFRTVIFALAFAAIKVAMIMIRGRVE